MLKNFNKARIDCPVVVYQEINAVFWIEKTQKRQKKTKNFPILNVSMKFLSIFDRLRGLECWKQSTWHNFEVQ